MIVSRRIPALGAAAVVLALIAGCASAQEPSPPAPAAGTRSVFITLGTQSGPIPFGDRSQPANVLLWGDQAILIDAGDGAAGQLAKAAVPLGAVRTVFISHLHFDHVGGLFGFLGMRYQAINPGEVTIYGPIGTRAMVDGLLAAMTPSFDLIRRPAADYRVVELTHGDVVELGAVKVTVAANSHYRVRIPEGSPDDARFQSLSFRFDLPDRSIAYTGDTGPSDAVARLAEGVDLLVSEVIDPEGTLEAIRRQRPDASPQALAAAAEHFSHEHLPPAEAARLARDSGARALVLTHIGGASDRARLPAMGRLIAETYSGPVTFAEDLDRF